jgi:hypothetical protein
MQGLWLEGARPKSKKAIKDYLDGIYETAKTLLDKAQPRELVEGDPEVWIQEMLAKIEIEATSLFGDEFGGPLTNFKTAVERGRLGSKYRGIDPRRPIQLVFVGPDPHTNRKFYGTLYWDKKKERWMVR